jgi:hypothetical protein
LTLKHPSQSLNRGQKIAFLGGKLPNKVKRNDPNRGGQQELAEMKITQRDPNVSDDNHSRPEHCLVASPSGLLIQSMRQKFPNASTLELELVFQVLPSA